MNKTLKINHLTSVHPRYDTRIFLKMCSSLASQGFDTSLIVADGHGDEHRNDVSIIDVGKVKGGRIKRMTQTVWRVYKKAIEVDADVYHLHDPELLPIGLLLRRKGKIVIFDAHEDVPKQILGKPYLKYPANIVLSKFFTYFENWACKKLGVVIGATPFIQEKFLALGVNSVAINNYPILGELSEGQVDWSQKKTQVCYLGGISRIRGTMEIVSAMNWVDANVRLMLAGTFFDPELEETVKKDSDPEKVVPLGWVNRLEAKELLAESMAGLVTLHPVVNYLDALPVKMFEYMSAGLPVIASNFSLWRDIIESSKCGVCVDPLNPQEIAEAINFFVMHPDQANEMGRNGQEAILKKYNWAQEEQKLFELYRTLKTS